MGASLRAERSNSKSEIRLLSGRWKRLRSEKVGGQRSVKAVDQSFNIYHKSLQNPPKKTQDVI
ncbi:MAG: hypothetical protein A2452_04745 [Candidatus Firestonebacteria bacterium RIFOXYC2_FULL_39_67]|nr:MAG: hypothetical protein A2536_11715 [Candidatus Firestonebacteria bacterium RIFOXYD2_FULL_39_29]OGF55893.1 MAG: hypothetical protein A2452_04745 [Candidatus Firestonebacteria bacterium RIFOXYC2_FULL_39_67]